MMYEARTNPTKRLPELVQVVAPSGKLVYVNSVWRDTLGYQTQDLTNLSLFDILEPSSKDLFKRLFQKNPSLDPETPIELGVIAKDGRRVVLEGNITLIAKSSKIACAHGTFTDQTETRREEDARLHAEPSYRTLIENALDIISIFDPQGIITSLNPSFERITGWNRQQWIGKPFISLLHPGDREYAVEVFERSLKGIKVPLYEARVVTQGGGVLHVESSFKGIYSDRALTGILGISRDISDRKRMEEQLRESEMRFHLLADACFDGIVVHEQGVVIEANEQFAQMHGYTLAEVRGQPVTAFTAPEYKKLVEAHIQAGLTEPYHKMAVRKDGARFRVEVRGRSLPYKGRLVRVAAVRPVNEINRDFDG